MKPQADTPQPAGGQAMTVSQLAGLIKNVLSEHAPVRVKVVGEVSNFSDRTHWFFSLKDSGATVRCVCFATTARRAGFRLSDGMEVVATGRLDFYEAQGNLQFYIDKLEPVGQGALELKLRQLIAELRELGYFDDDRKKPLPLFPQKVAVVTSRTGAALQDVINTAHKRWPGCQLYLLDVRVQGAEAAPEVAAAITALSKHGPSLGIDAIILTRGGGSMEDLWAFNERNVADAIHRCRLPIVAAIGHEVDTTVAELVADRRASTPTQAAMLLIPDAVALSQQVSQTGARLDRNTGQLLRHARQQLESLARQPSFRNPQAALKPIHDRLSNFEMALRASLPRAVASAKDQLSTVTSRFQPATLRLVKRKKDQLAGLLRQIEAVNPRNVLQRGYSLTMGPDGAVLLDPAQVRSGDRLRTVLAGGEVASVVEGDVHAKTRSDDAAAEAEKEAGSKPARVKRQRATHDESGGLFG